MLMIRQLRVNQDFSLHWSFKQTWPAVHVVRVIEQCYFDSTSDPSNGQTANFILKPPKVIDPRTHVKKANLEGFWNNTVLLLWWHLQMVKSGLGKGGFCIFDSHRPLVLFFTAKLSYAQLFKLGHSTNCGPHNTYIVWFEICFEIIPTKVIVNI